VFTGIIKAVGSVRAITQRGGDVRLRIEAPGLDLAAVATGDSIAVNGVCLTAVDMDAGSFAADVSVETLNNTTLGGLHQDSPVNLEPALTLASPLGGHLVTGHVDGVGRLISRRDEARSWRLEVEVPGALARYIARKGSVCVDGISLTVNEVNGPRFGVNIVPHTMDATNLGQRQIGDPVNIEVDIVARYLERLVTADEGGGSGLTRGLLEEYGFAESH
jgi:riboflavin synthase